MTNKQKYIQFCGKAYIPVYSQSWWMDAVCTPDKWNVWLYENSNEVMAAMPYYFEKRGSYRYITKTPMTQNNGIIFKYTNGMKEIAKAAYEEKVINAANEFIEAKALDVYEQQYHYNFKNYLPFYWNGYMAIPRYTYVIDSDISIDDVWKNVSSKQRSVIKKGKRFGYYSEDISKEQFYEEHEKVFLKQSLDCPFSYELWESLYENAKNHGQGKAACYKDADGHILSLIFWVWDEKSVYQLLGGGIPQYQQMDTYDALIWDGICQAKENGKAYDFEGSMIKRVSKSMRQFGGQPMPYFRIRKVFNPEIIRAEAEKRILEITKA